MKQVHGIRIPINLKADFSLIGDILTRKKFLLANSHAETIYMYDLPTQHFIYMYGLPLQR